MDIKRRLIVEQIPALRRYALTLTRNSTQADDLLQDCLERAMNKLSLWTMHTNLRAWLFTMMRNLYLNSLKGIHNSTSLDDIDILETASSAVSPEENVYLQQVQNAMQHLRTEFREVLLLVAVEGMRYEEVARLLDIPVGTVMSRLSRARQQLLAMVEDKQVTHLRRVK